MEKTTNKNVYGVLLVLACAFLWSTAALLIKLVPWNPLVLAGGRGLFSGIAMLLYLKLFKRRVIFSRQSFLIGGMMCVTSILYVAANKLTTAANTIVLQYTSPVFIILISVLFFKKKFRWVDYLTVCVTLAGIVLFFLDELSLGGMFGNVLALIDGMTLACVYIFTGENDPDTRLSGIMIGSFLSFLIGGPFAFVYPPEISAVTVSAVAAMGVLNLALPYILYSFALRWCPPLACSLVGSVELILNPLWVMLFIGEVPGSWALIGAAVIVAAITAWCILDAEYQKKHAVQIKQE